MIDAVLSEIRASAEASLPACIQRVAALREVALEHRFTVYDWWQSEAEFVAVKYPALFITWDGTASQVRSATKQRAGAHAIQFSYLFRATDMSAVRRQLLHVPEAVLTWLDAFPILSKGNEAATILGVAVAEEIEIAVNAAKLKAGGFVWAVEIGPVTFQARDTRLA